MKVKNAQRRILRAIFFRQNFDSLDNIWYEHKFQAVFELYISELIKEMFKQIRLESPVLFSRHIHAKSPIYQLVGAQERESSRNIIGQSSSVNVLKILFGKFIITC